jgi:hypothetical protein
MVEPRRVTNTFPALRLVRGNDDTRRLGREALM